MKNFVSADPLFAELREELSSYINSGAIDDLLWPKYLNDCLKMLRKSALPIKQCVVNIHSNQGELPKDFDSVKEVWATTEVLMEYPNAAFQYYQRDCRLDNITNPCHVCNQQETTCDACDPCKKEYLVVHKVMNTHLLSYKWSHPLKPGNLQARGKCSSDSINLLVDNCQDTFDISGCDIMTSFSSGILHLIYYSNGLGEDDDQLIPDDYWVQDFIMKYIRFKVFDKLWNLDGGETFNQSKIKRDVADVALAEAKVIAFTELKKETRQKTQQRTAKTQSRYQAYYRMLGIGQYGRKY